MALRGRFGRRRRGGQNLTALIASLMAQQRAAQDRVWFDAYNQGGQVDGKPVTDERFLAYLRGRRNMFTRDDPLWDEWNNRSVQVEFRIGESKIVTAFRQGKVGAGSVAAFYRNEMTKVPQNSPVWREMAQRAADWAKSAAGAARGAHLSGLVNRLNATLKPILDERGRYVAIMEEIRDRAIRELLITSDEGLEKADPGALYDWLNAGAGNIVLRDGSAFEISGGNFQELQQLYYRGLKSELSARKRLNEKAGRTVTGNSTGELENATERTFGLVRHYNALDDYAAFEDATRRFEEKTVSANFNPLAIQKAKEAYMRDLGRILDTAAQPTGKKENEPDFLGYLSTLRQTLETGTRPAGAGRGELFAPDSIFGQFLDNAAERSRQVKEQLDSIASASAYFGQENPGETPHYVATAPGTLDDMKYAGVLQRVGGELINVYIAGREVRGGFLMDQKTGLPLRIDENGYAHDAATDEVLSDEAIRIRQSQGELRWVEEGAVKDARGNTLQTRTLGYVYDAPDATKPGGRLTFYGVITPQGVVYSQQNPFVGTADFAGRVLAQATESGLNVNVRQVPAVSTPSLLSVAGTQNDLMRLFRLAIREPAEHAADLTKLGVSDSTLESLRRQAMTRNQLLAEGIGPDFEQPAPQRIAPPPTSDLTPETAPPTIKLPTVFGTPMVNAPSGFLGSPTRAVTAPTVAPAPVAPAPVAPAPVTRTISVSPYTAPKPLSVLEKPTFQRTFSEFG